MKLCKKCKKKVANKAKICRYCGADVSKAKIIKTDANKMKKEPVKKTQTEEAKDIKIENKTVEKNIEIQETKSTKKESAKNIKKIYDIIKEKSIQIFKIIKKYIIVFIKFIIKILKKIFNKIKINIKKLDQKIKEKEEHKKLKPIEENISKKSGIVTDTLAPKEEVSYETTKGIPIIVPLSFEKEEKIDLKKDFKKLKERIKTFIEKQKKKTEERKLKRQELKELREKQKLEKQKEEQISEEKPDIGEDIDEDEYEGISIKKVLLFILILLILASLIFVFAKKISFHHDNEPQTKITEKNMGKTFNMNEAILYKGIKYKVTKAETSEGTEYRKPKEGNEYIVVTIHFENQSKEKQKYSYRNWKMSNSKDEEKSRIFTPINVETALYSGTLVVASEKDGSLVFEQPKNDEDLVLNFYSDQQLLEIEKEKALIEKENKEKEEFGEEKVEAKQVEKREPIFRIRIKTSKKDMQEKSETEA